MLFGNTYYDELIREACTTLGDAVTALHRFEVGIQEHVKVHNDTPINNNY